MFWLILVIAVILLVVIIFALCKTASISDERADQIFNMTRIGDEDGNDQSL